MLAALADGAPLSHVIGMLVGEDSAGRAAHGMILQILSDLPTLHSRRKVLEHFLRTFEWCHQHGSQWRVTGAEAFVGQVRQTLTELIEKFDPDRGEVTHEEVTSEKYLPSESAGGLAAHSDRSPRQLHRYREFMRKGGLMRSQQPPSEASDAEKPRSPDGRWAYAQHWLAFRPTPAMVARWKHWAPMRRKAPQRPKAVRFDSFESLRGDDWRALVAHAERGS